MNLTLNYYLLLLFATFNLILAIVVHFNNEKNKVATWFSLILGGTTLWIFTNAMTLRATDVESGIFWSQISYFSAVIIAAAFFYFSLVFPDITSRKIDRYIPKKIHKIYLAVAVPLVTVTVFIPEFTVRDVNLYPWQIFTGPGIYIFSSFFLLTIIWTFRNLIGKYFISTGIEKMQLRYLFSGMLLTTVLAGITNLILPVFFGNYEFVWIGPLFTAFLIFSITYTILNYRLLNIRILASRALIYLLSFSITLGIIYYLYRLKTGMDYLSMELFLFFAIIASIAIFKVVFNISEKLGVKYLYYSFYSYEKVIKNLSKELNRILDFDKLCEYITSTLIESMNLERAVVLVRGDDTRFKIGNNIGFKRENGISMVKNQFLVEWLQKNKKPLIYDELSLILHNNRKKEEEIKNLQSDMKKIEAEACLPLIYNEKIIGLMVLGNKKSREPFTVKDIELLTTLSNQASIAIKNAKLYAEVENLSQNLERKVEEKTKELRKALDELKAANRSKTEFIAMSSHQLRTPLTAMKGYISMIKEERYGEIPDETKEKLEDVLASTERLINIVNQLLDISRIELGKMKAATEKEVLNDVVMSTFREMEEEGREKDLEMNLNLPSETIEADIDRKKIEESIINLIDNSIKYTDKGSIEVGLEKKEKEAIIYVKDTGEGLSEQEKKDIFKSFTRGDSGKKRTGEGAGLGLHIAQKYVSLHEGDLYAKSEGKGKGATFFIELPLFLN